MQFAWSKIHFFKKQNIFKEIWKWFKVFWSLSKNKVNYHFLVVKQQRLMKIFFIILLHWKATKSALNLAQLTINQLCNLINFRIICRFYTEFWTSFSQVCIISLSCTWTCEGAGVSKAHIKPTLCAFTRKYACTCLPVCKTAQKGNRGADYCSM